MGSGVGKAKTIRYRAYGEKNLICTMTRHHAEPNINILLTRNLPFDSDIRQLSHLFIIPLHCLTRGKFKCDVLGFVFVLISFGHMHGAIVVPWFAYVSKLCK